MNTWKMKYSGILVNFTKAEFWETMKTITGDGSSVRDQSSGCGTYKEGKLVYIHNST